VEGVDVAVGVFGIISLIFGIILLINPSSQQRSCLSWPAGLQSSWGSSRSTSRSLQKSAAKRSRRERVLLNFSFLKKLPGLVNLIRAGFTGYPDDALH